MCTRRLLAWLLIASLASCTTTRSSAGMFVTDIRVHGTKLVVDRCEMKHTLEDKTGAYVVLLIILIPLMVMAALGGGGGGGGGGLGESKTYTVTRTSCVSGFDELPGAMAIPGGVR